MLSTLSKLSLFCVLLTLIGCKIPLKPLRPPVSFFETIQLDSLRVIDLSENMSRLSTQEDEIVLLTYSTKSSEIVNRFRSPMLLFSDSLPVYPLNTTIDTRSATRVTFFLLEIDNDSLSQTAIEQCSTWVTAPSFPDKFQHPVADSLLHHDDLLGMRSYTKDEFSTMTTISFSGRQLFDRFHYELYLVPQ